MSVEAMAALLALATTGGSERIAWAPTTPGVVRREFEIDVERELQALRFGFMGRRSSSWDWSEITPLVLVEHLGVSVVDTIEAVEHGRPRRLVRELDQAWFSRDQDDFTWGSEDAHTRRCDGPARLEGQRLVFEWNDRDRRHDVELLDEGGAQRLEEIGLTEDCDLRGFAPGRMVAPGDSWYAERDSLAKLFEPGGAWTFGKWRDEPARPWLSGKLLACLDDGPCVTFSRVERNSGRRVAVLDLSGRLSGESSPREPEGAKPVAVPFVGEVSGRQTVVESLGLEVEGRLLWDLERNLAFELELEAAFESERRIEVLTPVGQEDLRIVVRWRGVARARMRDP